MSKTLAGIAIFLFAGWTSVVEAKRGSTVGDLLKKIEKQAEIKKTRRALPKFKKVTRERPPQVNLRAVKPPSTSKLYFSEDSNEAELAKVTDAGINQLYKLTQRFKSSSKRGELWLRLAELYVEKSRLLEYQIYNEFDKKIEAYENKKLKSKPRINLKPAQSYNRKAIQLYEWFLRDFPKDPKVPQAYFFLGYNYFEIGDKKKGEEYYKKLSSQYPKSSYVDESNFALGEYFFENNNWKEAEIYYRRVVRNQRSRLYAFAMFKLAWSLYKQGQYDNALKTVEKVIYHGRKSKGRGDKSAKGVSSVRLASEALKDLVVFYAEAGDYKDAYDYFYKVAGKKTGPSIYERLGYYYADRGNRTAARHIFSELIRRDPISPKAFELKYKLVTMFSTAGSEKIFKEELFEWIEQYGPGSSWQKANAKNQELINKSQLLAEATLRNFTLQYHQTAQNSRAKHSQDMAQSGYQLYFTTFKNSERQDEMHFFYGELLYDLKSYSRAAASYIWVVENAKSSQYFKQSLLNAILSLERLLPSTSEIRNIVGENTQPIEFDKSIKDFERLAKEYFEKVPNGENTVEIKYKLGTLYYYYNQFEPALAIFKSIVKSHPKSKFAEYSANLILDIYNLRKDYVGLEKAADEILAVPGLKTSGIGAQVDSIKQRSIFKQTENLEKEKKYSEAAESYKKFAENNKGSALGNSAYYNSAVNFEKGGNLLSALGMYAIVVQFKGKQYQKLVRESRKSMIQIYERVGKYPEAAEAMESYANDFPTDPLYMDYIFNAAVIREGMRYYTAALRGYKIYLDKSKKADRWEALFYMGRIWQDRNKYSTAISYFEKYMNSPTRDKARIMEAAFRIATMYERLKNSKQVDEWYNKIVRIFENFKKAGGSYGVKYAAEAKFNLVKGTYDELRGLKIPKNPQRQGAIVQKKLALLDRLKEGLKQVVKFDDAYQVVAALTLQGQGLQHMSAALYNAPAPSGLNAEQLNVYKTEVEKLAKPLLDQALESYKAAISRGIELGGYNDWLLLAMKELNRVDANQYPDFDFKIFLLEQMDDSRLGKSISGSSAETSSVDEMRKAWRKGKKSEILDSISNVLDQDSNHLEALNLLGIYYYKQRSPGLARLVFERAQSAHPKTPALHNNLGILELSEGDQRQAILQLKSAIALKSSYEVAVSNLSSIYLKYRDYKRALGPLEDSYRETKRDLSQGDEGAVRIASNYAAALTGSGDPKRAKSVYENVLDGKSRDIDVMMNYAILLVRVLKEKKEAVRVLSKIKFVSDNSQVLGKVKDLEQELEQLD